MSFHPTHDARVAPRGRITVLHLIHTMAYGGVESVVLNWLSKLDPTRFEVHLACFANPGGTEMSFVGEAERCGFTVTKIPWGRRKPLWQAARALARLLRMRRVQVLHTHNEYADFVGAMAARLSAVKTVATVYVRGDFGWRRNVLQAIDRLALHGFDSITAHCEETRQQLTRLYPRRSIKTLICGFAVSNWPAMSLSERRAQRQAAGIADDQVLLVNVARLYPEKAQAFLLECFAEIVARAPRARLWIVGVGPLEAELKRRAAELNLNEVVRFLGWQDHWASLLPLCDVQVHPTLMEGVSLAVGEGMAAGLPVIASNVGGLGEIIKHQQTGLFFHAGDAQQFIEQTLRLIEDEAGRRRLGAAGRSFIEREYSLEVAVRNLEETYREVMKNCASASL